jgi:hypothetical protein
MYKNFFSTIIFLFTSILNKIASSNYRWPKKETCLEELTGLYGERACAWCMKVAGEVMLCCRWNGKENVPERMLKKFVEGWNKMKKSRRNIQMKKLRRKESQLKYIMRNMLK